MGAFGKKPTMPGAKPDLSAVAKKQAALPGKISIGAFGKKPAMPGAKPDLSAVAKKPAALGKMDLNAFGKKTPFGKKGMGAFGKKSGSGNDGESHGLLEGISSLHSWIKSQTMMKPGMKKMGKIEPAYDPVYSSYTAQKHVEYEIFNPL